MNISNRAELVTRNQGTANWIEKGIINHLIECARVMTFEDFSNYFIVNLILKQGNRQTGMNIHKILKCKNSTDSIYNKLKTA